MGIGAGRGSEGRDSRTWLVDYELILPFTVKSPRNKIWFEDTNFLWDVALQIFRNWSKVDVITSAVQAKPS